MKANIESFYQVSVSHLSVYQPFQSAAEAGSTFTVMPGQLKPASSLTKLSETQFTLPTHATF